MTVSAVDVTNRCPVCLPKGTIDTPGGRSDFLFDIGIFRDLCSALRSDLQISHFPAPLGPASEGTARTPKAVPRYLSNSPVYRPQ